MGWLGPEVRTRPAPVPVAPARPKQGPFPPGAFCCTPIDGTTTPSDSRCATLDFTIGLYERPCPDQGCADGSLLFPTRPCPRAVPHTPGSPVTPVPGRVRRRPGLHRDVRGSALPLFLCRGGRVHLMLRPACLLPPLRLLTPRYRPSSLEHKLGPATRCSGLYLDGTHTRWSGGTFRTHHGSSLLADLPVR